MKTYELTYIISPEITAEEAGAEAKNIESFVQENEGLILRQNNPIAKTLSYPIKKHASGFMGVLEFQLEPEKLIQLKEKTDKDEKIIRHMIIMKRPLKEKKERRTQGVPQIKPEPEKPSFSEDKKISENKEKVELKDIEEKLEEILGQ